jgi:hypothetical protein
LVFRVCIGSSFCGFLQVFFYILSMYLEAHCAFFDIYNIVYKKNIYRFVDFCAFFLFLDLFGVFFWYTSMYLGIVALALFMNYFTHKKKG